MMAKKLFVYEPSITDLEKKYVFDCLESGWISSSGEMVTRFGKLFSQYIGTKHAIPLCNGTAALHIALLVYGIGKGDEVICPAFTFAATANAVIHAGAKPVLVDIEKNSLALDSSLVEKAITAKTKAVIVAHLYGIPADVMKLKKICKKHNLILIEDAAESVGATCGNKYVGSIGDIGCFSFQGAKIAVSGEGGIFVTNNETLYKRALLLSSMGRTDSQAVFWSDMLGFQYTIANLTAAMALAQVERIDELVAHKREIYGWYKEELDGVKGLNLLEEQPGCVSNYCYPSLFLPNHTRQQRDAILLGFKELNIHARPAFPRMSEFPIYAPPRFENPVATSVAAQGISLPAAGNLKERDVRFVARALKKLIKEV
jgi:perosamine synthetase